MGGLIQLAAYGNQDVFLTGNPQITFWKMVFKRHTNFAVESIEQPFTGTPSFGSTNAVSLPKNTADLIHKCHVQVKLKRTGPNATLKDNFGLRFLKRVIFTIDGMDIDSQTGDWMEIWNHFTLDSNKKDGYEEMIGNSQSFITNSQEEDENCTTVLIPLQLYFCENAGLSLPIHALQYSEVKLKFEFNEKSVCVDEEENDSISIEKCSLFAGYVYLDTAEKKQILKSAQEFLITQTQEISGNMNDNGDLNQIKLDFLHPVKELVWVLQKDDGYCHMKDAYITMNGGQKRECERPAKYFRLVQALNHHTNIPKIPIYMYSFALKPEEDQSSGTCNFSRLDNSYLNLKMKSGQNVSRIKIYGTNTNLLRIMSGKGALAYS